MLRQRDIAATVGGAMIGSGIFIAPTQLASTGAPPLLVLLLFGLAGIVAILGAFTLVSLARAIPGNGGPYLYLRRLHPRLPALFNWSRFWVIQTGVLALLSLFAAQYLLAPFGVAAVFPRALLAVAILAVSAAINTQGIRAGARFQLGLTLAKVGALVAVSVGILAASDATFAPVRGEGGLGAWALTVAFAFGGWTQITFIAGETKTDLRRPVVAAIIGVTVVYLVAVAAMLLAPTGDGLLPLAAAEAAYGESGRVIMSFVIASAALGATHTLALTGPKLYAAAANDGNWWHPFCQPNRHGAHGKGILFQTEWAAILVGVGLLTGDAYFALIGGVATAIWFFHAATALSWFRVRHGSPVPPTLFLAVVASVLVLAIVQDMQNAVAGKWGKVTSLYAMMIIASGIPYAFRRSREPAMARSRRKSTAS